METRVENLVIFFFLAILQQDGGVGMTFGTMAECVETRAQVATDPRTMFLSECTQLPLTPITLPKENRS